MKVRLVDKCNPRNIKCDYCGHFTHHASRDPKCLNEKSPWFGKLRHYWNRCKWFVWRDDKQYKGES
jgi:hypothetical protein